MAWVNYDATKHGTLDGKTLRIATWSHLCKLANEHFETCSSLTVNGSRIKFSEIAGLRKQIKKYTVGSQGSSIYINGYGGWGTYTIPAKCLEILVPDVKKQGKVMSQQTSHYEGYHPRKCTNDTLLMPGDTVCLPLREVLRKDHLIDKFGALRVHDQSNQWLDKHGQPVSTMNESSYKKIRKGTTLRKVTQGVNSIDYKNKRVHFAGTYGDEFIIPFEFLEFTPRASTRKNARQEFWAAKTVSATPIVQDATTKSKSTKKESTMITPNFNAKAIMDQNKDALLLAAKIEVGEAAVKQVSKIVRKQMPMMIRGYAELPVFDILVANLVVMSIKQFAPENEKAQIIADAMLLAAMQKQMREFNIPQMVDEFVSGIDVSAITRLEAPKDVE